jgi:serine/threonine protein kinase
MRCPYCRSENELGAESCFTCGQALSAPIKLGSLIASRYEVLSPIGKGGMGTVYLARDRVLAERVAVKVLRPDVSRQPDMTRRFLSEMALARKVRHQNVVPIYAAGEEEGRLYVCMALVNGVTLKALLGEKKGLPPEQAFDFALQLGSGLQAMHDIGLVHRDVKSLNVMVDARGGARLMDLDIARQHEAEGTVAASQTGQILGTPDYMSPEYARGEPLDPRSDIYSLGVLIFEMFTGETPFHSESPLLTILKHLHEPPPLKGGNLPGSLVPVLKKALAKRARDRYSTVRGMATALGLARAASGALVLPPPKDAPEPLPALLSALNPMDVTVRISFPPRADPAAAKAIPVLIGALGEKERPPLPPLEMKAPPPAEAPDPIAILVNALRHEDPPGRARAARVLGGMGSAAQMAIPVLLEALRDRETAVRVDAAEALERMGAAAQEALAAAVHDPDEVVRQIAAEAVIRILKRKRARGGS